MTSPRKLSIALLVVAALAGLMAAPAQAITLDCSNGALPSVLNTSSSYTMVCNASGGAGFYGFSIIGGNLPSGFSYSSNSNSATISGTPVLSGSSYAFNVQVMDSAGSTAVQSFSGTVSGSGGTGGGTGVTLSSVSPSTLTTGVNASLSLFGSGFTTNSIVYFNNIGVTPSYVSTTQLNATIPAGYIITGSNSIFVNNGTSSSGTIFVTGSSTGTGGSGISLSSLSQTSAPVGSAGFTLYLYGTGFSQGAQVAFGSNNLGSTYLSSGQVSVFIPASFLTTSQTVNVSVGGSNTLPFVIGTGSGTGGALSVNCTTSGQYATGAFYSQFCSVSGGNGTYIWSASGLPTGLSYSSTSGSTFSISGTITGSITNYTVNVSDSSGKTGSYSVGSTGNGSYYISSISPTTLPAGSGASTVVIFGNGFTGASQAFLNGTNLSTQYVSTTQLNAIVPAYLLASQATYSLVVNTNGTQTPGVTFTVGNGSSSSGISISSITPTSAPLNGSSFTLTIFGSGFSQGAQVVFGNNFLSSQFISSNQLQVTIPSNFLTTAQTVQVGVSNSNTVPFVIGSGSSGGSLSVTCSPTSGPTSINTYFQQTCFSSGGTSPFTWTVSGLPNGLTQSAYTGNNSVSITGTPTTQQSYSYTVQVTDSSGSRLTGSTVITGNTGTSAYSITSLTPNSAAVGSAGMTLTVFGTGFSGASQVYFNGSPLPTTYISTTQLNATLSSAYLTSAQNATVTVNTSGISTNSATFTVGTVNSNGSLSVTCNPGIGPATVNTFYSTSCTATGGNGNYTWTFPSLPPYLTTSASSGSVITISGTPNVASPYNFSAKVTDTSSPVQTGTLQLAGATNNSTSTGSSIILSSLSPSSASLNSAAVSVTVTGSGFSTNSQVIFDGFPITTTYLNGGQLTATIPAGQLTFARSALVNVTTPGAGNSNSLTFVIGNGGSGVQLSITCNPGVGPGAPNLYYQTNCAVNGGNGPYTWSIVAGALPSGLTLNNNGAVSTITGTSSFSGPYSYTLQVSDGASPANTATLTFAGATGAGSISTGGFSISSVSPSSTAVGSAATTITVNGSGFASGAQIYFNGSPLATTYISSNQLTATIPATSLTSAINGNITVLSSGVTSNALTFTVGTSSGITISCTPTTGPATPLGSYTTNCTANGGRAPYAWSTSGLPFGLALTNSNSNTVAITGSLVAGFYNYTLSVTDSSTPAITASYPFAGNITGGASTITSMSPVSAPSGSSQATIILTGSGFTIGGGASVYVNGSPVSSVVNSDSQITATIPASFLTSPGSLLVSIGGTVSSNTVNFFVTSGSVGGVSPGSLSFTYGIGGSAPAAQTLTVTSLGGSTGFSAVPNGVANGVTWLTVIQPSATVPGSIQVAVNPGTLPLGTYTGSVTLTGFGTGATVTIPVTLTVAGPPALTASPNPVNLSVGAGGTTTQTVKITTSDNSTVLNYTASAFSNNGGNWLSVSPASGSTPGTITITAASGNLTPSTYSGTITLTSTGSLASQLSIPVSLTVTSPVNLTASPNSLTFNAVVGQSNPATQTINITSSNGTAVNFTPTATTAKGGSWLTVTGSGSTPGTIQVSVSSASLAADTYTGTVTIASSTASNTPINIPVTLVVGNPASLVVNPQSLSFSWTQNTAAPAGQTLNITNSSAGAVTYTITPTTSVGGSWLSTSSTTGTTPSSVTVNINPNNLAVGTFNGNLAISAPGATTVNVPVTLTITAPTAVLTVTPTTLTFNAIAGGSAPATQTVAVSASNSATVGYNVAASSSGNWLSATASGTTPGTITVTATPGTLAIGQYTGTLTITSTAASNSPQTVNVTLNVTSSPQIVAAPSSLVFSVPGDGSTPASQTLTIVSNGANTSFTASAVSQGNWLNVTGGGTTPGNLTVTVNPAGLLPGQSYNGSISITATGANPSNIQVPVTLTLANTGAVTLQVLPSAVYLNYTQGAGADLQHVTVINNGGGTVTFTATAKTSSCGSSWLTPVTPTGSATPTTPGLVAFNVSPAGLNSQTCRGTLTVTDSNNNVTNIPVFMAISSLSQSMLLSQTAMNFSAVSGGTAPASQTFQILNPGSGTLQWTAAAQTLSGGNWLSVTPNSGSSQSLSQPGSPISVSVDPTGLAAGTYYGMVNITSSGANNSPQVISVSFTVGATGTNPAAQVVPNGVILTVTSGASDTQTVNVSNLGSNSLTYSSVIITDDGQNWLTATPATGTLAGGSKAALNISANLNGIGTGLRHGTLRLAFSDGTVQSVDVQLANSGTATGTGVTACGSSNLAMEFLTPSQNFQTVASVAVPLQVLVKDCSGNTLTSSTAGVDVLVNNQDIHLNFIGNGVWSGTWTPTAAMSVATLTARAVSIAGAGAATGVVTANGVVGPAVAGGPPVVAAVVNAASFLLPGFVAPGTMVSVFGSGLADGQQQVFSIPFPTTLQGAKFSVRGVAMPLFYASDGQVNGVLPIGLNANERDQLVVIRDTTISAPIDLLVGDVDPGAFATNQQGTGQGAILVDGTSQVAAPAGSLPGAGPTSAGHFLSIFLSGLGAVSNPPADGSPSNGSSVTPANPTVTIGGIPATVSYSGLAPGEVGLYQVNVQVPAGVPTGNAVPVVVTLGNGTANTVTVALQ